MSNLESALDELYGADLDSFVATRSRLQKELRSSGSKAESAALGEAKKPVVAAWVINRLARQKRKEIDLLLDAGHRLRQAQEQLLQHGDRKPFDAARKAEQNTLDRLTKAASEILKRERGTAPAGILDQVSETLRAAAVSEQGRAVLARGQLIRPMAGEGFEPLSTLKIPPRAAQPKQPEQSAVRAARSALNEARKAQRAAEQAQQQAEREANQAKRLWQQAEQRAENARADASEAKEAADAAEREHAKIARRKR